MRDDIICLALILNTELVKPIKKEGRNLKSLKWLQNSFFSLFFIFQNTFINNHIRDMKKTLFLLFEEDFKRAPSLLFVGLRYIRKIWKYYTSWKFSCYVIWIKKHSIKLIQIQ